MEKITVDQAAKDLKIRPNNLRQLIREEKIPFAAATKKEGSSKYIYVIFPAKYKEYVGI